MATRWIVLLLVGCAIASPWPFRPKSEPLSDEEARRIQRRELINDPAAPAVDRLIAVNEEQDVNLFEIDIRLDARDKDVVDLSSDGDVDGDLGESKRSVAHRDVNYRWVQRVIPYVIESSIDADTRTFILQAINEFHTKSCIRWVERTNEPYYILFQKLTGCWSYIGNTNDQRGFQEISLGTGCNHVGIIMHEMLHAMGFWHEQSRPDRNNYVSIYWENIQIGKENNFNKYDTSRADKLDIPYDADSIMQYGNNAFSANGKDTIKSITNPSKVLGQREGLSQGDINALNKLYSCTVTNGGWSDWSSYGPCDETKCEKSRSRFCTDSESKAACNAALPSGIEIQTAVCPPDECHAPVDGHWGRWSAWGSCSKTCDEGTFTRTRQCDDPQPKNGGASCSGSNSDTSSCKLQDCGAGPGDCGFDDDAKPLCDWSQDPNDDKVTYKDFLRGSATPSSSTGPQSGDHGGNGKFAYSEASDCINTNGKYVRLLSPEFPATGSSGRCFTFWYYAYGYMIADFNVYVRTASGTETKIGTIAGQDRGQVWNFAKFHFTQTSEQYRIVLESKCGLDYRADFAIDDTKFLDGACPA